MAKDFFADIGASGPDARRPAPARAPAKQPPSPEKSIRNISVPTRRDPQFRPPQAPARAPESGGDVRIRHFDDMPAQAQPTPYGAPREKRGKAWLFWLGGIIVLLLAAIAGGIFFFTSTRVSVTPRTHTITFDPTTEYVAHPASSTEAQAGGMSYAMQNIVLDDSATVPATGVERAEDRAAGTITVYNDYSEDTLRLIKNTRFETPDGLVFRIASSIEVPGKTDSGPGILPVTVFADQPGDEYNVAPVERFSLPGLRDTSDMYQNIYARSTDKFSGGFIGERPVASPSAVETARTQVRERLANAAREAAQKAVTPEQFAFPQLVSISYESLPTTAGTDGSAVINERATARIPVFPAGAFAGTIAEAVRADGGEHAIRFTPGERFSIAATAGQEPDPLGERPLSFVLDGSASLVWEVSIDELAKALAGREQGAFEAIVASFPSIDKAEAKIAPFWSSVFPADPADIEIEVQDPVQS